MPSLVPSLRSLRQSAWLPPSTILLLLAVACGGATTPSGEASAGTAGANEAGTASGGSRSAGGTGSVDIGNPDDMPRPQPGSNEPPLAACAGGLSPEVFARPARISPNQISIAGDFVYWNDGLGIMRQAKSGSASAQLLALPGSDGVLVDTTHLYWWNYPHIYGAPLTALDAKTELASSASRSGWAVSEGSVFYVSDPAAAASGGTSGVPAGPVEIVQVANTGAPISHVPLSSASPIGPLAADATGAYWFYNAGNDPSSYGGAGGRSAEPASPSGIRKLTSKTGEVSNVAAAVVIEPGQLVADGAHLVWSDSRPSGATIWSSEQDGTAPLVLGGAPITRGLASDGVNAYWAASEPGNDLSDIISAPLGGGPTQVLACHVPSINGLLVDDEHVYFFTWTSPPIIGRLPKTP